MLSVCTLRGKVCVNSLETLEELYTFPLNEFKTSLLNPQFIRSLHNFSTQLSTAKSVFLTDTLGVLYTVSTKTIITTTII